MGLALVTYISFNGGVGLSLPFVLQARLYTMLHSLCWRWNTDQLYIMQAIEAALQIHVWAHSSTCFARSVCTHCAWKMDLQYFCYLMAIFGLHRFKQDMLGHAVILLSFTMDFLDFCSEPMFWKGSKSKSQFYCKDMVNPMQWHRQPIATILWVL
jgi:hypothetical protein